MDLLDHRDAIVAQLQTVLPKTVTVYGFAGRFSLEELERHAVKAPCVLVSVLNGSEGSDRGELYLNLTVAAYVLTKAMRGALPAESGLKLSTVILQAVSATDFSKQAQSPTGLRFDNLYSSALGEDGVWLGAVGWRQLSPLQAEGADALGEFLTLHTDFDFPPADGRPEAVDHLAVRGRASTEPTS